MNAMQQDLFAPPAPLDRPSQPRAGRHHKGAKSTEIGAALSVTSISGAQRVEILRVVANAGYNGMTQWEIVDRTNILRSSVAGRVNDLTEGGWLEDSGRTRVEKTNRPAIVWVATERGRRFVHERTKRRASS
jgi:hypothetical protein